MKKDYKECLYHIIRDEKNTESNVLYTKIKTVPSSDWKKYNIRKKAKKEIILTLL